VKTAEEWANQGFSFGADTKTDFVELLKSIQLDARIAGLREAAELVVSTCCACNGTGGVEQTGMGHACDGSEEDCARRCPVPVQEIVQCEYCGRPQSAILSRAAQLENHLLVFETLRWNVSLLSLRIARQIRRSDD